MLAAATLRDSDEGKRAALWTFVVIALLTIPTFLTGEPAEHAIEDLPGVEHSLIEEHEESALLSLIAIEVLGAAALAGLFLSRRSRSISPPWILSCLLLAIVVAAMLAWTSHLGGHIRHPESRADFVVPAGAE